MAIHPLTTSEQWHDLLETSDRRPVIVFKHSDRCGGSAEAEHKFQQAIDLGEFPHDLHRVVVQTSRKLSDKIAADLRVRHHTPQVIVISRRRSVYDVDHRAIDPTVVKAQVDALTNNS